MTFRQAVRVECDNCFDWLIENEFPCCEGCNGHRPPWSGPSYQAAEYETVAEALKDMAAKGWVASEIGHLCPSCDQGQP